VIVAAAVSAVPPAFRRVKFGDQPPAGASQASPVVSDDFATMLQLGKGIVLGTIVCDCG